MKKLVLSLIAVVSSMTMMAQTMKVTTGNITYLIPASQAGDMTYNGNTLTIMGKEFQTNEITAVSVDNTKVSDNTVTVAYSGNSAQVTIAGNVMQHIGATVNGAHVSITQGNGISDDTGKVEYILSGSSSDGEFYLKGDYKMDLTLNGVTLINPNGAPIDIQNGKKVNVSVKKGTENTLTDCENGSQKACFVIKGHAEFKGQGTLNINAKTAHGIKTSDFFTMKNCTINVLEAVKDGIHANEFFLMESGTLNINNVGDDGIQAEIDNDEQVSTGITTDHEEEDSGNIYITGGNLTITVGGTAAKCIKSDTDVFIDGGTLTLKATGEIDLTETDENGEIDPSYTMGIKANNVTINDGTIDITVTGTAGRGISAENTIITNGGTLTINNSGAGKLGDSDNYTAKGLKSLNMALNAGIITINVSGAGGKGIRVGDGTKETSSSGGGGMGPQENQSTWTNIKGYYTQGLEDGTGPTLNITTTGQELGSNSSWWYSSSDDTSSPKAIKAICSVIIYGGETTVKTSNEGGEGLESKTSIDIRGGKHYFECYDDCINSAGKILFNGGVTVCYSNGNDAVDSNYGNKGAITIGNGVIFAYSTKGGPEEGLDCDNNSNIQITGTGIAISAGGSQGGGGGGPGGMGGSSGNTISGAVQGYAFVTSSISYAANTYYTLQDANGNNYATYSFPTSCSSRLAFFTAKGMKSGTTYYVKSSRTAPTDATTAFHGLYLGSTAVGSTSVTSFTAK